MDRRLGMNRQHLSTRYHKGGDVSVGIGNHQMDVERQFRDFLDRPHHRWTDRDVGNEVAIHHIDVKDMSAGLLHLANVFTECGEIRRQNGGRQANTHWLTSRRMLSDLLTRYPAWGFC